jgi:hypothetical protein
MITIIIITHIIIIYSIHYILYLTYILYLFSSLSIVSYYILTTSISTLTLFDDDSHTYNSPYSMYQTSINTSHNLHAILYPNITVIITQTLSIITLSI